MSDRNDQIESMLELIYFLRDRPDIPLPSSFTGNQYSYTFPDQVARAVRALGACEKQYVGEEVQFVKRVGEVNLIVFAPRETACTKRVVGQHLVKKQKAIGYEEVEELEDVVEWDCGGSVLESVE